MAKAWTRRRFLGVVGGSAAAGLSARPAPGAPPQVRALTGVQRATLRVAADDLIPASDGMPSAGEAGAGAYLERLVSRHHEVVAPLGAALDAIERLARARHRRAFARLGPKRRLAILAELERSAPESFLPLRNLVYEGYYTQPVVQKRLGFEFVPDDGPAAPVEPFDERPVARVRGSGRLYREVR
jgi:hypothetical protein